MRRTARFASTLLLAASTALVALPDTARADAALLTVDLVNEPSSLDPHMQWNPDSYYVYRNIFDNLVTRLQLVAHEEAGARSLSASRHLFLVLKSLSIFAPNLLAASVKQLLKLTYQRSSERHGTPT